MNIDYLLIAYWLTVFIIVGIPCVILEIKQEKEDERLNGKVHGRVPCKVRRRYGSRVRYV